MSTPSSSRASRTTPATNSSPGLMPPPGVRQIPGGKWGLRISASRSPLKTKSVTSWRRAGLYTISASSGSLTSPSHSSRAGSPNCSRTRARTASSTCTTAPSKRPQDVEQRLGTGDLQVGGGGQIVRAFLGDDRHSHCHIEPVEAAEGVEIGCVVAGIERPLQACRREQASNGRPLVGVDRRPYLE